MTSPPIPRRRPLLCGPCCSTREVGRSGHLSTRWRSASRPGLSADGSDGVGAVRAFRTGKVVTKERITALEPERRFAYEAVEIPRMSDYRAVVELHELPGGGTRIRWHGTYSARWGMRWFLRRYLRRFMRTMATGLAGHAAGVV